MAVKPGFALTWSVLTKDPTTGKLQDATSVAGFLRHNGVLDAAGAATVTHNGTGDYKLAYGAIPSAGYADGDSVEWLVSASETPSGGGSAVPDASVLYRDVININDATDVYARIGAPAGASLSADLAANTTLTTSNGTGIAAVSTALATAQSGITANGTAIAAVPGLILANPANKIATNAAGQVSASNLTVLPQGTSTTAATNASVVLTSVVGMNINANYGTQKLWRVLTGEFRLVASSSITGTGSTALYTLALGSGTGENGPFSTSPAVTSGEIFALIG